MFKILLMYNPLWHWNNIYIYKWCKILTLYIYSCIAPLKIKLYMVHIPSQQVHVSTTQAHTVTGPRSCGSVALYGLA